MASRPQPVGDELPDDRRALHNLVAWIKPVDEREAADRADPLAWIASDAELYRRLPPADPPKHPVTYFLPYHAGTDMVFPVEHRKARRWLPPGGHVEPGEPPWLTIAREAAEELGIVARPHPLTPDRHPLFATATHTVGPHIMNSQGVSRDELSQLSASVPRVCRTRVRASGGRHVSQSGRYPLSKRHPDRLGYGRGKPLAATGIGCRPELAGANALAGWMP